MHIIEALDRMVSTFSKVREINISEENLWKVHQNFCILDVEYETLAFSELPPAYSYLKTIQLPSRPYFNPLHPDGA